MKRDPGDAPQSHLGRGSDVRRGRPVVVPRGRAGSVLAPRPCVAAGECAGLESVAGDGRCGDTTLNVYTQVLDGSVREAVEKVGGELFTIVHKPGKSDEVPAR